jgi:endonuclease YncB( thermonuclease family)
MKIRMGIGLIALFATVVLPLLPLSKPPVAFAQLIIGVVSVIDGDTIEIHGQRLRLHGIDSPESRQLCTRPSGEHWRCSQQAAFALADRIGRATVQCEPRDSDRYGRIIAICFANKEDLSRWSVENGWAAAYRQYSMDYAAAEARARTERRNIWSGRFEMPWDWRAEQRNR